jgi:hypothetical protein
VPLRRRLGSVLGLAGLGFILVATLTPVSDPRGLALLTPLFCLVCGDQGGADVVANLLLFLPLAVGLRLRGATWTRVVLLSFLLSLTVELLQLRLVPGRDASLSDLVSNTASGAIGATLGSALPGWVAPSPERARAFLAAGLALVLALLGSWAWLLMPVMPKGRLISRWAHEAPGRDVFDGRVQSVRLDTLPMPTNGPPPDSADLRRRIDAGHFDLAVDVVSGRPVSDRFWIYMFRVPSGGALTLNQFRREAGLAVPARGLRYKLHPILVTLADAFPDSAGVAVHLSAGEQARRIRLSSSYEGRERAVELGISPALGWMLVVPFQLAVGTGVRWVTAALLFVIALPLGYWGARCQSRWQAIGLLIAGMLLGLWAIVAAAGLPPVHWSEWLAAVSGGAVGWQLSRAAASASPHAASTS